MKRALFYISLFTCVFALKSKDATATHGMVTWASLPDKPILARVATDSSYHHLRDTPNLNVYVKYSDTNTTINTAYKLALENKAMKDTAAAIRASMPSLSGYVRFSDTSLNIATRYDIFVQNKAMKDSVAILRGLLAADTNNKILYYGSSGRITNRIKKWVGNITPTVATDQTISITTAGFSTILSSRVDAIYNGQLIWCQVNTVTTSTITLDLYRPNTSLVTILGLNVLQGVPFLTGNDLSNISLHVEVTGY